MRRRAASALLALAAALGLGAGAAWGAPKVHTVIIEGMAFVPSRLTVHKGDSIVWVNRDLFPHTATADDASFDSHEIAPGKSWKTTVLKPDKVPYSCTLHPSMKGMLIVQ